MKNLNKLFTAIFLLFICSHCSLFKDTEGFKEAQKFLEAHPVIIGQVGKITNYGNPSGSYNLKNDDGTASFQFSIEGEKTSGRISIDLEKRLSKWNVISAYFMNSEGKQFNLKATASDKFEAVSSFFSDKQWGETLNPAVYKVGDTIFFHAILQGLKADENNQGLLQMDAEVTEIDGEVARQEKVLLEKVDLSKGTVPTHLSLPALAEYASSEKWNRLKLIFHDRNAQKSIEVSGNFRVLP